MKKDDEAVPETQTITVRLRSSSAVEVLLQKKKHKGTLGKNWPADLTTSLLRDLQFKVSEVTGGRVQGEGASDNKRDLIAAVRGEVQRRTPEGLPLW